MARNLLDQMDGSEHQYAAGDVVQFPTPDGMGTYAGSVLQVGREGAANGAQTGAVLFDAPIPSEDGLEVTFEQWQYGNTTRTPAD